MKLERQLRALTVSALNFNLEPDDWIVSRAMKGFFEQGNDRIKRMVMSLRKWQGMSILLEVESIGLSY